MVTPEPIESRARFLAVLNDLTLSTSELIGSSPKLTAVLEDVKADSANQLLRLSMLGELAASLAHEIKQPIAAALIDARVCLRALADNRLDVEAAREAASRLVKDAMRADEIIKRTTALYKKDTTQRERVAVNAVIRETALLLQQEASASSIAIRTELAEEMPDVMADPVQLQQALMNLMLNAIEAMKDTGGELTVTSQLGEDSELLIEVRDTGVGLPAENPHQIFESFVTTKPHGTGMGLAITRSIVESHGGRLWAIANTGPGATFLFTLPSEVGEPDTSPQGERMRADIVAPAVFPDYELTDHAGKRRKLSDRQGPDPMILVLSRGAHCPKDLRQAEGLVQLYREMEVGYCRLVMISTDNMLIAGEYRTGVGAHWTFLSDPGRKVQKDLDIAEYRDPEHDPMIPHVIVLEPGLVVFRIYNGYWFFGQPTLEELRQDLRVVLRRCRPDWDITAPGFKAAWNRGERDPLLSRWQDIRAGISGTRVGRYWL